VPDFVLVDEKNNDPWNFEIKRLVPQHVRRCHEYARRRFAILDGKLPGIYTCEIRLDAANANAFIPAADLDHIIRFLYELVSTSAVPDYSEPVRGYRLTRVDQPGSRVEPWLWDYELEPRSARESAVIQLLLSEFDRHLESAREKFDNLPAARNVLVFETRGTLLDRDIHMLGPFADGPDLLARFYTLAAASGDWTKRDTIIIDPHISVWRVDSTQPTGPARTIMTGTTNSADLPYTPLGSLVRLWPGGCPYFVGIRRHGRELMQPSDCGCSYSAQPGPP
jgi:hypothetical protein